MRGEVAEEDKTRKGHVRAPLTSGPEPGAGPRSWASRRGLRHHSREWGGARALALLLTQPDAGLTSGLVSAVMPVPPAATSSSSGRNSFSLPQP